MEGLPQIMVAPNGARRTETDHPALPMSAGEIAITARACHDAGAGAIHLHVRDDEGQHSLDAGRYRETMAAIAEAAPEMAVQITTESAGRYTADEQYRLLRELRPAWISLSVREMARDFAVAARVYALVKETGTRVQHILYSQSCAEQLQQWIGSELIREIQTDVLFVLGKYAPPVEAKPEAVSSVLAIASKHSWNWSACAFGPHELACMVEVIMRGGCARVGFENNIHAPDGTLLVDNAASVILLKAAIRNMACNADQRDNT